MQFQLPESCRCDVIGFRQGGVGNDDGVIDEGLYGFANIIAGRQVDIKGEFVFEKILQKSIVGVQIGG